MPQHNAERTPSKFERVFEQIDDLKTRVTKIEAFEEHEKNQIQQIIEKLDEMSATLNQIIGKESVRATISGVIGAIVSGVVVWVISLLKG